MDFQEYTFTKQDFSDSPGAKVPFLFGTWLVNCGSEYLIYVDCGCHHRDAHCHRPGETMTDLVCDFVRPRILSLGLKAEKKEKIHHLDQIHKSDKN